MSAALSCLACGRAHGSTVPFCPFCGAAQQRAAPPPIAPAPAPPPVAAIPEPAPAVVERSPPDAVPGPPPAPAPQPKPPVRWRRRAVLAAAIVIGLFVAQAALAPLPRATLVVRVRTPAGSAVPSGRILIDGSPAGGPGETLTVRPGTLKVTFEEPGWQADARSVVLAKDASLTVDLTARELPGHLVLTTTPAGAAIRILNRNYGPSPVSVELAPGNYTVSVTLGGYVAKTLPVTLARGETRTVSTDLAPVPAPPPPPQPRFQPAPFERGVLTLPTPLLSSPARTADTITVLPGVSEVQVQAQVVTDDTWLQVRAGGRQGFVPAIGAVEAWDNWAQRRSVAGPLDEVTPGLRAVIAGIAYPLFGVKIPDRGLSVAGLARVREALDRVLGGKPVQCVPHSTTSFDCKTPEGNDLAEYYLLNGAALAAEGAPPYYFSSQQSARDKRKGIWSE